MTELLGIALEYQRKREALRANLEARGASEAAMARFPVPTKPLPPLPSRTVLAKGEWFNTRPRKEPKKREAPPSKAVDVSIKRQKIVRHMTPVGADVPPQMTARIKAIAGEVAKAAGVPASQVLSHRGVRYGAVARHLGVYFAARLTDVPLRRIAEVFSFNDHTGARYSVQRSEYWLNTGHATAWAVHDRAAAAIKARWPEYAAYAPAVAMQQAA